MEGGGGCSVLGGAVRAVLEGGGGGKYLAAPAHARTRAYRPAAPRQSFCVSKTLDVV